MDKKNSVKKGYKRSFRLSQLIPCSNVTYDEGAYCVHKATNVKTAKKRVPCAPDEELQNNLCYKKCKPGFIGKGKYCISTQLSKKDILKNAFKLAAKKSKLDDALKKAAIRGRHTENFSNTVSEWLNYNKIDKSLSDLFDDNLKQYRWFFVGALLIVTFFVIVNLLSSATVPVPVQQPTIIIQVPAANNLPVPASNSLQVPQQALQAALQQMIKVPETQISPVKSQIPIKITDLNKTGGFNRNLFSDLETSIFSEWTNSD